MQHERLTQLYHDLHLSAIADGYGELAQKAVKAESSYTDFLELSTTNVIDPREHQIN